MIDQSSSINKTNFAAVNINHDTSAPLYENSIFPLSSLTALYGEPVTGTWNLELCYKTSSTSYSATFNSARLILNDTPYPSADLSLTQTVSTSNPTYDTPIEITLSVHNSSNNDAEGVHVSVEAPIPSLSPLGFQEVSKSAGDFSPTLKKWMIPSIPANQTYTLVYRLDSQAGEGKIQAYISQALSPDPDSNVGTPSYTEDDEVQNLITTVADPNNTPPGSRNICYLADVEVAFESANGINTLEKYENPNYFGPGGSVAPETITTTKFWTIDSSTLDSFSCDIWWGGGTNAATSTEATIIHNWLNSGNHYLIAGCDSGYICNMRTSYSIANGDISIDGSFLNPLSSGGLLTVQTFGGGSKYYETEPTDVVLATVVPTGEASVVTDKLGGGKFLITGDADMFGSSGKNAIGSGAEATTQQALFVVNVLKLALDEIAGRPPLIYPDYNNPPGIISGFVYGDVNGDDAYQSGSDSPIPNVTVKIYADSGTPADTSDDLLNAEVVTDSSGAFSANLSAENTYLIQVDTTDSNLGTATLGTTNPLTSVSTTSGSTTANQNFGFDNYIPIVDTDGDGTSDNSDLDADNDGILDTVEGRVKPLATYNTPTLVSGFENIIATAYDTSGTAYDVSAGTNATDAESATINFTDPNYYVVYPDSFEMGGTTYDFRLTFVDAGTMSSTAKVYARNGLSIMYKPSGGAGRTWTMRFALYASGQGSNPTATPVTVDIGFTFKDIDGNTAMTAGGISFSGYDQVYLSDDTKLVETAPNVWRSTENISGQTLPRNEIGAVFRNTSSIDIIYYAETDTGTGAAIRDISDLEVTPTPSRDSDGDGVDDYLDLDSDNDGIPDNVEAQTTAGYQAPSGTFDSNGVYDNYSAGLTPVDTDGDNTPDYLDTDSDNDTNLDKNESGLTLPGTLTVGNNGLENTLESNDNYTDVNANIDVPKTALPNSQDPLTPEVDYRDDNDNTNFSFTCEPGFYQVGNDVFRKLNPATANYESIHDIGKFTSIAYNHTNNIIYGQYKIDNFTKGIAAFQTNGVPVTLGTVVEKGTSTPMNVGMKAVAIGRDGFMWMQGDNMSDLDLYKVNLSTFEAELVSMTAADVGATPNTFADFAYLHDAVGGTNRLYARTDAILYILDLDTKTISTKTIQGDSTDGNYGGMWTDINGRVFTYNNVDGNIYRVDDIDTASPQSSFVAQTEPMSSNDGASCPLAAAPFYDFGDLPNHISGQSYKTTLADNAPLHVYTKGISLGTDVSEDLNGFKNATDVSQTAEDDTLDDGVYLGSIAPANTLQNQRLLLGNTYQLTIPIQNLNNNGKLSAWIDWNLDGDFLDANEQIATDLMDDGNNGDTTAGDNTLNISITVPNNLTKDGFTGARFRFSSQAGLSSETGEAIDGEIEDYWINLTPAADFGDAPDTGAGTSAGNYLTLAQNDGAMHVVPDSGATRYLGTTPPTGKTNATVASGDASDDASDDGVFADALHTTSLQGQQLMRNSVTYVYLRTTGTGVASAWIDFNGDGDFDDVLSYINERFAVNATPSSNMIALPLTIPADASLGTTYIRVRYSSDLGLSPTGRASDGEVEDYRVEIIENTIPVGSGLATCFASKEANGGSLIPSISGFNHSASDGFSGISIVGTDLVSSSINNGSPQKRFEIQLLEPTATPDYPVVVDYTFQMRNAMPDDGDTLFFITDHNNANGLLFGDNATYAGVTAQWNGVSQNLANYDAANLTLDVAGYAGPTARKYRLIVTIQANGSSTSQVKIYETDDTEIYSSPVVSAGNLSLDPTQGLWFAHTTHNNDPAAQSYIFEAFKTDVSLKQCDYGDLSNTYGLVAHDFASDNSIYLGTTAPDLETQMQNADAGLVNGAGDDTSGTDDEDGVFLGDIANAVSLQDQQVAQGMNAAINIKTNGTGVLNAWVDWNKDGDFADANEQIATNVAPTNDEIALNVSVPSNAALGKTYARFRYASASDLSSAGETGDGEVEDYSLEVIEFLPFEPTLPTEHCSANYYRWNTTFAANPSEAAHKGTAFTDMGWVFDPHNLPIRTETPEPPAGASSLIWHATHIPELDTSEGMLTGETALVVTRLEYAANTAVTLKTYDMGTNEHYIMAVLDSSGNVLTRLPASGEIFSSDNNGDVPPEASHILSFTTPADGIVYYYVWIADFSSTMRRPHAVCMDFGDAQDSLYPRASHGVRKGTKVRIGTGNSVDQFAFETPADATGDAKDDGVFVGIDHTDRLLQGKTLIESNTTQLRVKVQGTAGLSAWVDWNNDQSFDEVTERIATNLADDGSGDDQTSGDGYIDFNVTPPAGLTAGTAIARFRYTTDTSVKANGAVVDGEVEDYQVNLESLTAFQCVAGFYQVGEGQFRKLQPATASYDPIGNESLSATSIAYNSLNNLIYYYTYDNNTSEAIVGIISPTGEKKPLGVVRYADGSPHLQGAITASIDKQGDLWIYSHKSASPLVFHKIKLSTLIITEVVMTGDDTNNISDYAYLVDGANNRLYGRRDESLYIVDLDTQTRSIKPIVVDPAVDPATDYTAAGAYGAIWSDSNGTLYTYNNTSGNIYKITNLGGAQVYSTLVTTTGDLSSNDGASCPLAPAPFYDFGDLPAPYKTLLADGGAQHGYLEGFGLGTLVNEELNGYKDGSDDGDGGAYTVGTATADDSDDGVYLYREGAANLLQDKTLVSDVTYSLEVPYIDTTGRTTKGKLSAWADWNQDGLFDGTGETIAADLEDNGLNGDETASDGKINVIFTVPSGLTASGNIGVRFRFSSASGLTPNGIAIDGEVEDYFITVKGTDTFAPFTCVPGFYQVGASNFLKLNPATANYDPVATIGESSIAYNTANNVIYGIRRKAYNGHPIASMFMIDSSGQTLELGIPIRTDNGQPLSDGDKIMAIDGEGFVWTRGHRINLASMEAKPFNFTGQVGGDWAYRPSTTGGKGLLVSVGSNGLSLFDLDSMVETATEVTMNRTLKVPTGVTLETSGAIWLDSNNNVYFYLNSSGNIYKIEDFDSPTPSAKFIVKTSAFGNNDGASCPLAPAPFYDFGDLPAPYKTLLANGGAQHGFQEGLSLGALVNEELNGYKDGSDDGDGGAYIVGTAASDDSDDGVFMDAGLSVSLQDHTLISTTNYTFRIPFVNTTGSTAKLSAWIDWNRDGVFSGDVAGVPEQMVLNVTDASDGTVDNLFKFSITPPIGLSTGYTGVRFRLSTDDINSPTGTAINGEVEDYWVQILDQIDHGDAPDSYGDAAHIMSQANRTAPDPIAGIYMGTSLPDRDSVALNTANGGADGTGDDADTTDDEDGVANLPTLYASDSRYSVDVTVTNTTGAMAYLVGWLDFDADGVFDADEAAQLTVPSGATQTAVTLNWNKLPANAPISTAQDTYLRLRLTTDTTILTGDLSTSLATGLAADGEVEDYKLTLLPDTLNLSGHVFIDANVNGGYDSATDTGHKDVLVVLTGSDDQGNNVCMGTYSKTDGSFNFTGIPTGSYSVYETTDTSGICDVNLATPPTGYLLTTPNLTDAKYENLVLSNADITDLNFGHVVDLSTGSAGLSLFKASQQNIIGAGETATYLHTFEATAAGNVSFTDSLVGNNWGALLRQDSNCDGLLSNAERSAALAPVAVNAGDTVCLVAQVTAPGNVSDGEQASLNIEASFTYAGVLAAQPATTLSLTDITTAKVTTSPAGSSQLTLIKQVRNVDRAEAFGDVVNQAYPGEVLEYRIIYTNPSSIDIDHLTINDMVPEYTTFQSAACDPEPAGLTCTAPAMAPNDALQWDFSGALKAGAQGSVRFSVQVQ